MGRVLLNRKLVSLLLLVLLAGQALATYSHHAELDSIAARAENLARKEKKLEARLKRHERRTKEMQAVWTQRKERIQQKIKARWGIMDFSKIGVTNIKALAEVDLRLTTENKAISRDSNPLEKLRALFAEETDELATLTHEIETKKTTLNQKIEHLEQLQEQAQIDKEHYDVKMEIYRRKLNFLKFKELLINETPQKRLEEIQKKKIEEQLIRDGEQKLLNSLKDTKTYVQKKFQEKAKKDEEKAQVLGLKSKDKNTKTDKKATPPSSNENPKIVQKPLNPQVLKDMIPHLGNSNLNLQATGVVMGNVPQHDGKSPVVVVNNHQTTIHVHHTPGTKTDSVDGTTRFQTTGVMVNGQAVTPHETNSPIAAILNNQDPNNTGTQVIFPSATSTTASNTANAHTVTSTTASHTAIPTAASVQSH